MSERQRAASSAHMKRLWADPEFRARHAARASSRMASLNKGDANRERARERIIRFNANLDFTAKRLAAVRASLARPERKEANRAHLARVNSDPVVRQKINERRRDALPAMSPDEKRLYVKLRRAVGRAAALPQVFRGRYRPGMYADGDRQSASA